MSEDLLEALSKNRYFDYHRPLTQIIRLLPDRYEYMRVVLIKLLAKKAKETKMFLGICCLFCKYPFKLETDNDNRVFCCQECYDISLILPRELWKA